MNENLVTFKGFICLKSFHVSFTLCFGGMELKTIIEEKRDCSSWLIEEKGSKA